MQEGFWNSSLGSIIRWILVPIASILGHFLAHIIAVLWCGINNIGFYIYNGIEVHGIVNIILHLLCQYVSGVAFVYCGCRIAPKFKKNTSIVLATILALLGFVSIIMNVLINFSLIGLIGTICSVIGGIFVAYNTEDFFKEK